MSEYKDNVARALSQLLIHEYPNILREELDRSMIELDNQEYWGALEVEEKCPTL